MQAANNEESMTYSDSLTNLKQNSHKRDDVRTVFPTVGAEKKAAIAPHDQPPV